MKQRSKLFKVNIVLFIVYIILQIISFIVIFLQGIMYQHVASVYDTEVDSVTINGTEMVWETYDEQYSLLTIEGAEASYLGKEYHGEEAFEGYEYYLVELWIHNAGTTYEYVEFLDIDCSDSLGFREYEFPDTNDAYYENMTIIPVGQTAKVQVVFQVLEDTPVIGIEYCSNSLSEEFERYALPLNK